MPVVEIGPASVQPGASALTLRSSTPFPHPMSRRRPDAGRAHSVISRPAGAPIEAPGPRRSVEHRLFGAVALMVDRVGVVDLADGLEPRVAADLLDQAAGCTHGDLTAGRPRLAIRCGALQAGGVPSGTNAGSERNLADVADRRGYSRTPTPTANR